ncbi:Phosphoglycolate phosphatase [Pirellulimonas nuda]|uniref:Phosphoglycolate phosphatase n=1 Tax=Pirellulimonas nuda TaxID=2528009 RepID=A0A518DFF0_9BACT|nr:HAD family hydrolase [Pirellulimonas nuda]QDU90186.1 Phosphoglycolate phosphatase [Pirellulimonas nuda]
MTDDQLVRLIAQLSRPLAPLPTDVEAAPTPLDGVRALLLDVYGTLLASASGDISLADPLARSDMAVDALAVCGLHRCIDRDGLVERLHDQIAAQHARLREQGVEFPEVDIVAVWRRLPWAEPPDDAALRRVAVEYECRVNPVWPMPEAAELLAELRRCGVAVGIVSNAQFYTPLAVEALLGAPLGALGFDPSLCVWSFEHLQAKPGRFLYDEAAGRLAAHGIAPGEALMVGNDLRNDIAAAQAAGLRTALFAGDGRSLRMRHGDPLVEGVRADAVVTRLSQLLTVMRLAPR